MTNLENKITKSYKNLYKKGAFGIFLTKLARLNDEDIFKELECHLIECALNKVIYNEITNSKMKHPQCYKNRKILKFVRILKSKIHNKKIGQINRFIILLRLIAAQNFNEEMFFRNRSPKKITERTANGSYFRYLTDKSDTNSESKVIEENGQINIDERKLISGIRQRNTILNYYLFKHLSDKLKKEYANVFYKRFDVKIPENFSKYYIKIEKPGKIGKSSFILWLGEYLENLTPMELSESSFDIAIKAGNIWNSMSFEEKSEWNLISTKLRRKLTFDAHK